MEPFNGQPRNTGTAAYIEGRSPLCPPTHRLATQPDAPAIQALVHAAYAKWVPVIGRDPLPMQADYANSVKHHRFDLLEAEGALVALAETVPQGDHLLLVNLAVHPAHQRRGLAGQLLHHVESLAAAAGLLGVRLYTNKLYTENIAFYAAAGYRIEREAPLNGGTAVHMVKPTPPTWHAPSGNSGI